MPTPRWFEDIKLLGELQPEELADKLDVLGDRRLAAELRRALHRPDSSGLRTFDDSASVIGSQPWFHQGLAVGHVSPLGTAATLVPIQDAQVGEPSSGTPPTLITIHLYHFVAAGYPGNATRRLLFHFCARHQTSGEEVELLHFNTTRSIEEGTTAVLADQPIFTSLSAPAAGVGFRLLVCALEPGEEAERLAYLDRDLYRRGLRLLRVLQPATALFSDMAFHTTQAVVARRRAVFKAHLGWHLGNGPGLGLRAGSFIVAQIPESSEIGWRWDAYRYHVGRGRVVSADDGVPLAFNHLVLTVDPWSQTIPRPAIAPSSSAGPRTGSDTPRAEPKAGARPNPPSSSGSAVLHRESPRATALADLSIEINVAQAHGRTRLTFVLDSPPERLNLNRKRIEGVEFSGSLETYAQDKLQRLGKELGELIDADHLSLDPNLAQKILDDLGTQLYQDLFPPELRALYREVSHDINSVHLVTDDPWIPWEVVKPFEAGGLDDDFLALHYELTRWLNNAPAMVSSLEVSSLACIVADTVPGRRLQPLSAAPGELAFLERFAARHELITIVPFPQTWEVLEEVAKADAGAIHVVGHGLFESARPEQAGIVMRDGKALRASMIQRGLADMLARRRRLVMLNVCDAARLGMSLTGIAGWAPAWIRRAACGAFLAPQWAVDDRAASHFTSVFYQALAEGATIAGAALHARRVVYAEGGAQTTALAYAVYSHPNAQVSFG